MLAVCMARDEADIIGKSVAHLVDQGCRVVVMDNLSTDHTDAVAADAGAEVFYDTDPAYRQSEKMTALAARFAREGEWVVPFDADEEWSNLAELNDAWDVANASPVVWKPTVSGWRPSHTEPYPKVAFRWKPGAVIQQGNHGVVGAGPRVVWSVLRVRHFQYRSLEQVTRKVRQGTVALDAAGLPDSSGAHWRDLARKTDKELADWWLKYVTA